LGREEGKRKAIKRSRWQWLVVQLKKREKVVGDEWCGAVDVRVRRNLRGTDLFMLS